MNVSNCILSFVRKAIVENVVFFMNNVQVYKKNFKCLNTQNIKVLKNTP